MNKNLYFLGNFMFALVMVSGILQSIFFFQLGAEVLYMDAYFGWMWVVTATSLLATIILMKYLHYKHYRFPLVALAIYTVASLCHSIILYFLVAKQQLQAYFLPTLIISLVTFIVFGISLWFSDSGKRPWLKVAGGLIFILTLFVGAAVILGSMFPHVIAPERLEVIRKWTSFFGGLIPLAFIMNFLSELKVLKADYAQSKASRYYTGILTLAAALAFIFTLGFGIMLAGETNSKLNWRTINARNTQKLISQFENRNFLGDRGEILPYLLLKPAGYDSGEKFPLLVCLPYGGYEGAAAAELLLEQSNKNRFPAYIFIPKCPEGAGWGGIANYPAVDSLVYKALDGLDESGIDKKRRYITGISRGGYGSWHFITSRPDLFAAAIPVCGGGSPERASRIADVAVWAFHGEKDKNVPVENSRAMIQAMRTAGAHPRYTEFAGEGHNIWHQVSTTPGLLDWLFAQKQD